MKEKHLLLGQVIKEKLNAKAMQQKDLAKAVGLTQQTISQYIHAVTEPDLKTLIKLAQALEISLDELITGEKYENKSIKKKLELSEKAIDNLKILAQIDFFDELLCDEEFIKKFRGCVQNFELNISAMRNNPDLDFFTNAETTVAIEFFNFFQDFFKRNNWVRNRQKPPKRVREQLEREFLMLKFMTFTDTEKN